MTVNSHLGPLLCSVVASLAGCAVNPKSEAPTTTSRATDTCLRTHEAVSTVDDIVQLVRVLPPWPEGLAHEFPLFTKHDWEQYADAARSLQRTDPDTVADGIGIVVKEAGTGPGQNGNPLQDWSKVYLLLRVMFGLPNEVYAKPPDTPTSFGSFLTASSGRDEDRGTRRLMSFPIIWSNGSPRLVAILMGYKGQPYRAVEEYRHFLSKYPFRDLTCQAAGI